MTLGPPAEPIPPHDIAADPNAAAGGTPIDLRRRTVAGFAWASLAAATNKIIGLIAQLVLARWLTRDEFGLIALTLGAATFALLLREAGVTQVLVQRGNRFDDWAGPAFGLIASLSLATGLLLATLAHPLAYWFGDMRLVPMLYVIAATCPLAGLGNVAVARLEHELRFRELGLVATLVTLAQYGIQTALAVAGLGAMSFVWGILLSTALRLVWLWLLCRPRVDRFFDTRAWRALLLDSLWVLGVAVFGTIVTQYDRLLLGKLTDLPTVGLYYFAFGLTTQTSQLLSGTLGNVLFPALSRLADRPQRQREVFLESSRLLSCVATPLCAAQVVLAGPMVALFGRQWVAAVPLVRVLSVGMAFIVCAAPGVALMQSQGRFRGQFVAQVLFTTAYVAMVSGASLWTGDRAMAVAVAVSAYFGIFGVIGVQLATRCWAPPWSESLHVFVPGVVAAAAGLAGAGGATFALGGGAVGLTFAALAYTATASILLRVGYPAEWQRIVDLAASVLRRGRHDGTATASVPGAMA